MSREKFKKEVTEDPGIKELLDDNAIVNKIKNGKCITSRELLRLEDLQDVIALGLEERIAFIRKNKKDSVPVPSGILKRG